MHINVGDLITLKGMKKLKEKPLGIVLNIWSTKHVDIMWLNETIAQRFALHKIMDMKKLDPIKE